MLDPRMTSKAIAVLAKPPRPGESKTRLAPIVGEAGAAALAESFLRDTWARVTALPWTIPILAATELEGLPPLPGADEVWPQGDGDLGARLERVLARAIAAHGPAIAIGADTPTLPLAYLAAAREHLRSADAVIGPAEDGGFYLLGLRACPPGLLAHLPWSSDLTGAATVARLGAYGLVTATLPPWFDVDRPADLERLRAALERDPGAAPHTAAVLDVRGAA